MSGGVFSESKSSPAGELHPSGSMPPGLLSILHGARTVFQFEFSRSRTWKRVLVWVCVAMFPAMLLMLMRGIGGRMPESAWVIILFVLVTEVVVLLNSLLWSAPVVQSELESKTWLYLAIRPFGRFSLVLGKCLNGLAWTLSAGCLGLIAALAATTLGGVDQKVPVSFRPGIVMYDGLTDWMHNGGVLLALTILSSLVYSSLFCAIGCLAPKRSMLIAISYTIIEAIVSIVPAVINRLTVQYHLRCLLTSWVHFDINQETSSFLFSSAPPAWHVCVLLAMAVFWQIASLFVVHWRSYVISDEN